MTLNLSHRKQAILEEMGIGLFLKKAAPLRPPQNISRPANLQASPIERLRTKREIPQTQTPSGIDAITSVDHKEHEALVTTLSAQTIGGTKVTTPLTNNSSPPSSHSPPNPEALTKVPQMDWAMLCDHLQQCQACEYGQHATQRYFSTPTFLMSAQPSIATPAVDWLIVSDTPKRSLDGSEIAFSEEGLAFLNLVLKHLGFSSNTSDKSQSPLFHHHISHTLKCLSPNSQAPSAMSTQTCLVHLRQEIKLLRPKVLLVMGQSAAQALLHDSPLMNEPLGRLRSKILQFESTPMVVTYTPEQMMRSGENKSKAWNDLCFAHSLCT
jgi:DNA polymerase